ncbi:hypothetical protein R6Q57_023496 [Mikania cordata]
MESKVAGYCGVAAFMGIIAAVTGFAAEATRIKASEVYIMFDTCVYPNSPALMLGIISAVVTIIMRIYISASFGGAGCCRTDPNSTPISKFLFVLSWMASIIAVALLLAGAGLNSQQGGQVDTNGYNACYVVKPGIFAGGAILALLTAFFGIAGYITSSQATTNVNPEITLASGVNVDLEKN